MFFPRTYSEDMKHVEALVADGGHLLATMSIKDILNFHFLSVGTRYD